MLDPSPARPKAAAPFATAGARALLVIGLAVFGASLLGLASRHAFSVSFWPANAVLVGLMIRDRRLDHGAGWVGAAIGFVAADLLFGRTLSLAGFFAAANLLGTFMATALLSRLDARDLRLRRVHSVPRMLACLVPACFAAGLAGALLVVVEFRGSALQALLTWPASELVNYLVTLPAMLTVGLRGRAPAFNGGETPAKPYALWPAIGLAVSSVLAVWFDGPGSIMFPIPALILCALSYPVSVTTLLTLVLGTGCLTVIGLNVVDIGQDMSVPADVVSIRVAIAFLVLAPLTISSAMAVRDELLTKLQSLADHDDLTGLLNRAPFDERLRRRLEALPNGVGGIAILWVDIDHFKRINDRFGHLAGDLMLQAFARIARDCCCEQDLIGRRGGEEFALAVTVPDAAAAVAVAEQLRERFAAHIIFWNASAVQGTISIGAGYVDSAPERVADLPVQLDQALYRAKRAGRDRVEWVGPFGHH